MHKYEAREVTGRARRIIAGLPAQRVSDAGEPLCPPRPRLVDWSSLDPRRGRGIKARARSVGRITFGSEDIVLDQVEQLIDEAQTRAIAAALVNVAGDPPRPLREVLDALERLMDEDLDLLDQPGFRPSGRLALPRRHELAAAVNRWRRLRVIAGS